MTIYSEKKMAGRLPADSIPNFNQGLHLVLYRWAAIRDAVENELGGPHSRQKAETLGSNILHWFTQSKAETLMILHEECLEGNFRSIEILREAVLNQAAHPHAIQVVNNDDEEEEEDNDNDGSNENGPGDNSNMEVEMQVPVEETMPKAAAEEEDDGWTLVSRRRNKGRN